MQLRQVRTVLVGACKDCWDFLCCEVQSLSDGRWVVDDGLRRR